MKTQATGAIGAFFDLTNNLSKLGAELGFEVSVSVTPIVEESAEREKLLTQRQREEFITFKVRLEDNPRHAEELRGKFVGLYGGEEQSTSTDESIARQVAAKRAKVDPEEILVIPMGVSGSEQYYENLMDRLGME